ncbi:hypothetical protein D3C76_1374420 [compost metagenome]
MEPQQQPPWQLADVVVFANELAADAAAAHQGDGACHCIQLAGIGQHIAQHAVSGIGAGQQCDDAALLVERRLQAGDRRDRRLGTDFDPAIGYNRRGIEAAVAGLLQHTPLHHPVTLCIEQQAKVGLLAQVFGQTADQQQVGIGF